MVKPLLRASSGKQPSLSQLNGAIVRARHGYEHGGSSQGRKAFFKRMLLLEAERKELYGIPAPKRRFNK